MVNLTHVHLHLLLNHVPTIGTIIAFSLLLLALATRNEAVKRASLALFFIIALMALPTYMTGYSAQKALESRPGINLALIDAHQSAALLALIVMEATGIVAWFGLWQSRKPAPPPPWNTPAVLLLSAVTIGLMANAAYIGGEISHPEILAAQEKPATAGALSPDWLKSSAATKFQQTRRWAWTALEIFHFIGLCLLFGIVFVANLRILGWMRNAPFVDIHRLLPWGIWGFFVNAVTGMMFFIGTPSQYINNPAFDLKVVCVLLAGTGVLYLTLFDDVWALGAGDDAPMLAKLVSASQVCLWVGVIYFGRMLPYIGNAF